MIKFFGKVLLIMIVLAIATNVYAWDGQLKEPKIFTQAFEAEQEIAVEKKRARPRFGIGFFGSYAMPSEGNYGSGIAYGLNLHLGITTNIALELGGLRYQSDTARSPAGLSDGMLSVIPIQLSIQVRIPILKIIIPYIRGGVGYSMNNFTVNSELATQWNNLGYDIIETVENSIEYHFGAGIDLLVHNNIALNGDVRYLVSNTKGTWTFENQIISEENSGDLNKLNLNSIIIGFGLKFLF